MAEQERAARRSPTDDVVANLASEMPGRGRVQDVSESGAFLWHCYTDDEKSKVIFHMKNKVPIEKGCRTARKDPGGNWIAVQFDKPLTPFELDRIAGTNDPVYLPGDTSTYDLAKIDRAEVFRETNQIKTCASNHFMWAMGLILPITLAIWALALEGKLNAISTSSAMIGVVIIFSVGVFSNLEKARAMNRREGFIAALDYYLSKAQGPLNYTGWVNLKLCFSECGARRRAKLCPLQRGPNKVDRCRDLGEDKANVIRSSKRVFPSILDSFMSLTSFFYGLMFLGLVILTVISFSNTWFTSFQIPRFMTLYWFLGGFLASFIVWRNKYLVTGVFLGLILALIAGVVFTVHSLLNCVSAGLGAMLGSMGLFCLRQVIELRVGHNSFETLVHTWLEIFENCIFLPDDQSKGEISTNALRKLLRYFLSYFSIPSKGHKQSALGNATNGD
jgi:hypothetical protein